MSDVGPSEIIRFMEKQDKLIGGITNEQKKHGELLAGMSVTLNSVLLQTTKTNGRVNRLEAFRNYAAGGVAVAVFAWGVIQYIVPFIKSQGAPELSAEDFNNVKAILYEKSIKDKE